MAVAFDALMAGGNQDSGTVQASDNVTSYSGSPITVSSTATLLVVTIHIQGTDGTIAATWDGVSMTVIQQDDAANRSAIAYLPNPAAGAKTLAITWGGGTVDLYFGAVMFKSVNTSAPVVVADSVFGIGGSTVTVPTSSNDATVAVWGGNGPEPTVNFTQIFNYGALDPGAGASYQLGGTTSNGHTFTGSPANQAWVGIHILAAGDSSISPPLGALAASGQSGRLAIVGSNKVLIT